MAIVIEIQSVYPQLCCNCVVLFCFSFFAFLLCLYLFCTLCTILIIIISTEIIYLPVAVAEILLSLWPEAQRWSCQILHCDQNKSSIFVLKFPVVRELKFLILASASVYSAKYSHVHGTHVV